MTPPASVAMPTAPVVPVVVPTPRHRALGQGTVHHDAASAATPCEATCDAPRFDGIRKANYFRIKFMVDRLITASFTLLALPLMAVVGLLILLLDGRPVFYRQVRIGRNGREFKIWKFRTMRQDAEQGTGAVWCRRSDPRVTPLGRWLRCSHLDELPQFFNVLSGDMNLIGPRPERPEFVSELAREIPDYYQRLAVRPGITGLAQLRLGYDQSIAEVADKVMLDRYYIRTASPSGDAWLLLSTLPYIAGQLTHKLRAKRCQDSFSHSEKRCQDSFPRNTEKES